MAGTVLLFICVGLRTSAADLRRRLSVPVGLAAGLLYVYVSFRVLAYGLLWPGHTSASAYSHIPGVVSPHATWLFLSCVGAVYYIVLSTVSRWFSHRTHRNAGTGA